MKRTLKMIVMLLCVATIATFSSCSKDNDSLKEQSLKEQIVGKWKCVSIPDPDNTLINIGDIFDFRADGTMSYTCVGEMDHYGWLKKYEVANYFGPHTFVLLFYSDISNTSYDEMLNFSINKDEMKWWYISDDDCSYPDIFERVQ